MKDKFGDDSKVDTPVPIPNTEVKLFNGENSVSEDSKLPIFFCLNLYSPKGEFFFDFYLLTYLVLYIVKIKIN